MIKTLKNRFLIFFLVIGLLSGCSVNYSFTGASIPPEVKTINIKYFTNNASLVEPSLSQKLTDAMKDKFESETNLIIVTTGGDLVLEGTITGYKTQPIAIQGNDQAALNRLTISIDVSYDNTFDEKMSFESVFSRYEDYESSRNLADVQESLIEEINQMLVEDVFNKAVINW
ncbi:MAG: hypothetical protein K8R68_02375 [Bacteroidales bacterium]|nr:hypothetical protein [Bacteroidales bacterium]